MIHVDLPVAKNNISMFEKFDLCIHVCCIYFKSYRMCFTLTDAGVSENTIKVCMIYESKSVLKILFTYIVKWILYMYQKNVVYNVTVIFPDRNNFNAAGLYVLHTWSINKLSFFFFIKFILHIHSLIHKLFHKLTLSVRREVKEWPCFIELKITTHRIIYNHWFLRIYQILLIITCEIDIP